MDVGIAAGFLSALETTSDYADLTQHFIHEFLRNLVFHVTTKFCSTSLPTQRAQDRITVTFNRTEHLMLVIRYADITV